MSCTVESIPQGPIQANSHIITDTATNKAAVVDVGDCTPAFLQALEGKTLVYILLTHGHFDHILGVAALKAKFPEAKICIHEADAECLESEEASLCTADYAQTYVKPDVLLQEGDTVTFGETTLHVMHTPGHTKGGVCYVDREDRLIFSGDTLFCLTAGRTDLRGGNFEELMASLIRLRNMDGDYTVYTGHNRATTLAFERTHNRYLRRMGQ